MPVIIENIAQNSPEWMAIRNGIPTSSQFRRILKANGERSKSWHGYIDELADNVISGPPKSVYESYEMRLGHEQEPHARFSYSSIIGEPVREVAFVFRDERRTYGSSTDGLVCDVGVYECKGGKGTTHLKMLRDYKENRENTESLFIKSHFQQLQGELCVTEREWVDLHKFYPGMRSILVRVYRDEKWISIFEREIECFCQELQETIEFARAA